MPPTHPSGPRRASLRPPHSTPSRLLARLPPPHLCPPSGLAAERVRVQPAAELQHVQRPEHGVHASGALRACPCHPLTSRAHAARHLGHRSPGPPAALSACLPLDSAGRVRVQPAADLRHFQRHEHAVHVCGAAPRLPMPPAHQSVPRCTSLRPPPPRPPASWPACRPFSLPSFGFGSTRMRSTSR